MDLSKPQNSLVYDYTKHAIREAQALVTSWGGQMVTMLIPTRKQVYRYITEPITGTDRLAIHDDAYTAMLGLCTELDLTCFDPLPQLQAFAQHGDLLYYAEDLHLNPRGNAILAEPLWGWLGGQRLLYD